MSPIETCSECAAELPSSGPSRDRTTCSGKCRVRRHRRLQKRRLLVLEMPPTFVIDAECNLWERAGSSYRCVEGFTAAEGETVPTLGEIEIIYGRIIRRFVEVG